MFEDKVVEAIKDGQIVRVSELQAEEEDLFVLRKAEQEIASGTPKLESRKLPESRSFVNRYDLRQNIRKNNVVKFLIENFNWKITRARREKGISRKQIALAIGENEDVLKRLEYGELPSDDFVLITKMESYLGIKLRKDTDGFDEARKLIDLQKTERETQEKKKKLEEMHKNLDAESLLGDDLELDE